MTNTTMIRQAIRNAYFCEDLETILEEMQTRLAAGKKWEADVLRELLNEALDELFDSVK